MGAATQCASPNLTCPETSCVSNKPLASSLEVLQVDQQLLKFVDAATTPIIIVDPQRPTPPAGQPAVFEGYELLTAQERRTPRTVRYHGTVAMDLPGAPVAGALVMDGEMATLVETTDGAFRSDVLGPYRLSRSFLKPGTGVVFFQWEDAPDAYTAQPIQVGYRELVLTDVSPALP